MDTEEVESILRFAHETRGVEFKASGSLNDSRFAAKVIRALLGMANKRNGGYVLIGVSDDHNAVNVTGLTPSDEATWNHDDLSDAVAKYADPSIELECLTVSIDAKTVFAIKVSEFDDMPVFCKRDYPEVLARRLYVRSRKKPETSEVAAVEDLREVIAMAVDKQLRDWVRRGIDAGVIAVGAAVPSLTDRDRFNEQLGALI